MPGSRFVSTLFVAAPRKLRDTSVCATVLQRSYFPPALSSQFRGSQFLLRRNRRGWGVEDIVEWPRPKVQQAAEVQAYTGASHSKIMADPDQVAAGKSGAFRP